jgi:hypothetical protein
MIRTAIMPRMLWTPNGFYCTYCDYYFHPELDRSGLPDSPVKWIALHGSHRDTGRDATANCPLAGKMFEINIVQVYPEAREVGRK